MSGKKKKSRKKSQQYEQFSHCGLPTVPDRALESHIDPGRAFLIRYIEKKWVNNTILHYYFFTAPASWRGSDDQKNAVRAAFKTWKNLGIGLEFEEVQNPNDAEVRIGFQRGGSWSYVGRDSIDVAGSSSQRTMNFGWDLTTPYGKDTALHEIGHALGFPHEHQNPNAGIVWDVDAVNDYFSGPPNNWDERKIHHNIIRKISTAEVVGTDWDKDSIMHYRFGKGLIKVPTEYKDKALIPRPGLSDTDKAEVRKFYPAPSKKTLPLLKPFLSQIVKVASGQQLDYEIKPEISRKYTIQTFGAMDTVIVLFEDDDGTPIYLDGDDDSGSSYNSRIEIRLISTRTYYLRLRLYHSTGVGQGGVMLW